MPDKKKLSGFSSTAIHSGTNTDANQSHLIPIYASSTYVFDSAEQGMRRFNGDEKGYIYSRWGNPTITEVEETISALESFKIIKTMSLCGSKHYCMQVVWRHLQH